MFRISLYKPDSTTGSRQLQNFSGNKVKVCEADLNLIQNVFISTDTSGIELRLVL